jgi:hypothetical protein
MYALEECRNSQRNYSQVVTPSFVFCFMTPLEAFKVLHLPTPPFTSSNPCPSKEQIKKAHRKLTLQTHPDKNVGKPEATAQNQECNNARDGAYEYITNAHSSDDNRDKDYDPTDPT